MSYGVPRDPPRVVRASSTKVVPREPALDLRGILAVLTCRGDLGASSAGERVGAVAVAAAVPQGARERQLDGDAQLGTDLVEAARDSLEQREPARRLVKLEGGALQIDDGLREIFPRDLLAVEDRHRALVERQGVAPSPLLGRDIAVADTDEQEVVVVGPQHAGEHRFGAVQLIVRLVVASPAREKCGEVDPALTDQRVLATQDTLADGDRLALGIDRFVDPALAVARGG